MNLVKWDVLERILPVSPIARGTDVRRSSDGEAGNEGGGAKRWLIKTVIGYRILEPRSAIVHAQGTHHACNLAIAFDSQIERVSEYAPVLGTVHRRIQKVPM